MDEIGATTKWSACADRPSGGRDAARLFAWSLEGGDLHRPFAPDEADGSRRPHGWRWFAADAQQVLAPTLQPGDNLLFHENLADREAIKVAGARMLFLPPYSADFNPIENAFPKLKSILRKAAARIILDLWDVIGRALPSFTPPECTNS